MKRPDNPLPMESEFCGMTPHDAFDAGVAARDKQIATDLREAIGEEILHAFCPKKQNYPRTGAGLILLNMKCYRAADRIIGLIAKPEDRP